MPVVFQKPLDDGSVIALWHITEEESDLLDTCTEDEREDVRQFTHSGRRKEWLAWHALLHELAPGLKAGYSDQGKPEIQQHPNFSHRFIGVSHTAGYAAVMLSPVECALDIEPVDRDFSRLTQRFIQEREPGLAGAIRPAELFPAVIWCAKETLYKWYGQPGMDFLRDIHIAASGEAAVLTGAIADKTVRLAYLLWNGLCIVYTNGKHPGRLSHRK